MKATYYHDRAELRFGNVPVPKINDDNVKVGDREETYNAAEVTGLRSSGNILAYMDRFNARPSVQRGRNIPEHSWA